MIRNTLKQISLFLRQMVESYQKCYKIDYCLFHLFHSLSHNLLLQNNYFQNSPAVNVRIQMGEGEQGQVDTFSENKIISSKNIKQYFKNSRTSFLHKFYSSPPPFLRVIWTWGYFKRQHKINAYLFFTLPIFHLFFPVNKTKFYQ